MPTRAYVRPGLMYMAGSERRNSFVVVFMVRQRNASRSWEGNEMRRVHREAMVGVGANRLGWNRRWKRGLAYRRTEETALCSTGHVQNGILFIGRGLAYRKMEETDLLRSKRGPVDREGCGVPQNGGNGLVLERYDRNRGPVHREVSWNCHGRCPRART